MLSNVCCTTNCRPCDNLCKILQNLTPQIVSSCTNCRRGQFVLLSPFQFLMSLATICAGKMKPNCTSCRRLHKLSSVAVFKLQTIMTFTKMMMMTMMLLLLLMMMMMMMMIMIMLMMMIIISVGGFEAGLGVDTNS